MARLKQEIVIPLADYVPNPGSSRMNIVTVSVERDKDRKVITLDMGVEYRGRKCRKFELFSGMAKRQLLEHSLTHSPKKFEAVADRTLQPFRQRQGDQWELLVGFLAKHGLQPAPLGAEPWLDPNE